MSKSTETRKSAERGRSTARVTLRLSAQELARIDRTARKRGISRNQWLRHLFAETSEAELLEAEERRQADRAIRNNVIFIRELLIAMLMDNDQEDMVDRVRDMVRAHLREASSTEQDGRQEEDNDEDNDEEEGEEWESDEDAEDA